MLTEDGVQWAAQTLGITQNSNGYPIVTSTGGTNLAEILDSVPLQLFTLHEEVS